MTSSTTNATHRGSRSRYSVAVTKRDLDTFVSRLREKQYSKATVAIRTTAGWDDVPSWGTGADAITVTTCNTALQLRAALRRDDLADSAPWRFFLTPLGDDDLPLDLREKLLPYLRVYLPDPSENLRTRFAATRQHSGVVTDARDIPAILSFLDAIDAKVTPSPAGLLSAAHLNAELTRVGLFEAAAQHVFNTGATTVDTLTDLLEWSQRDGAASAWQRFTEHLPDAVIDSAITWLTDYFGPESGAAMRHLRAQGPERLMSLGLAGEVLIPASGTNESVRAKAEGKFEMLAGLRTFETTELTAWAAAAGRAFSRLDDERKVVATSAHAIVTEDLAAEELLVSSTVLPSGLDARFTAFANALDAYLATTNHGNHAGTGNATATLLAANRAVHAHQASTGNRDTDTVDACVRLVQWLASFTPTINRPLPAWMSFYRDELSWVDSCLNAAWWRQSNRRLGEVAPTLAEFVRERRSYLDRQFSIAAAAHGTKSAPQSPTLMIEDVLSRVVEPLLTRKDGDAAAPPLLFIVLDGCSVATINDLVQSIMSAYPGTWNELLPDDDALRTALAVLPTVTTSSRASLLSGAITRGGQNAEKKNFTAMLAPLVGGEDKVVLAHKNDIATGINDTIRNLIEDTARTPVVGAVLNTIDDSLSSDSPMNKTWRVDEIAFLPELLHGAARVGRTVVLVSDHGHIPERHLSTITPGGEATSARWRPADGQPAGEKEMLVDGDRVIAGENAYGDEIHRAILAVAEDVRYTGKAAGYHGGLSPAEACVPITVLTQTPSNFAGNPAYPGEVLLRSTRFPSWWEIKDPDTQVPTTPSQSTLPQPESHAEMSLLNLDGTPTVEPAKPERDSFSELARGTGTTLNRQFKPESVANRTLNDVVDLLRDIDANHGRMPVSALKNRWALTPIVLQGVIGGLRRMVNMDGVEVLTVEGTDLVLNSEMLFAQFATTKAGPR